MKLSFITPEGSLEELATYSDLHLIIANFVVPGSKYTEFFKSRNEHVIMDCGTFEVGKPMTQKDIIKRAQLVNADEVVAPDILFDWEGTVFNAQNFIDTITTCTHPYDRIPASEDDTHFVKPFKVMVVPQGKTPNEWLKCYEHLVDLNGVDVIGLSCLSVPHCFSKITGVQTIMENRLLCVQQLINEGMVYDEYEYHLLGLGNPLELLYQKQHKWIRSCDTSSPIVHGINDVLYDPYLGLMQPKIKTKLDFKSTVPKSKYKNVLHNIAVLRKLACV